VAQHSRLQVYNRIFELGLTPLFYHADLETARQVVGALREGGGKLVEFTIRGNAALPVFSGLSQYVIKSMPEMILGVGSIVDAPTAALFIAAGANFIVGPVFNLEVARLCNRRKIAYLPGCGTLSEISLAEEAGAEIIKLFPGDSAGGPDFVRAVLGPMPWTNLMPTGGVEATPESIRRWFEAGVCAVGMGSSLISRDLLAAENFGEISERTAQVLGWIRNTRQP
jgi:2-dehydro-3-deoxyphosphogluconate aldolase/(4S)-4-hydroxy-2-oxoglutarate aldolase